MQLGSFSFMFNLTIRATVPFFLRALTPSYSSSGPCLPLAVLFLSFFPSPLRVAPLVRPPYPLSSELAESTNLRFQHVSLLVAPLLPFLSFVTCRRVRRAREFHEMFKQERRNPPSDTDNGVQFASCLVAALARRFPRE